MSFLYDQWYTPAVPNFAALQALLQSDGQHPSCKVLVLDKALNPVSIPTPWPGRAVNDLTPAIEVASIKVDSSQDVVRTANIGLRQERLQASGLALNTLQHRLQIYLEWSDGTFDKYGNPTVILSVCVGTFMAMFPDRQLTGGSDIAAWTSTWTGLTQKIANLVFWNQWDVAAGSLPTSVVAQILQADALPESQGGRISPNPGLTPAGCDFLGCNFTASQVAGIVPSPLITPSPVTWTWKDNVYTGLKGLLNGIAYYPIYDTPSGGMITRQKNYYALDVPDPVWTFICGSAAGPTSTSIIKSVVQRFQGLANAKNAVKIVSHPNSSGAIEASAFNTSSSSSISVFNLGEALPIVIQDDTIADQATAQLRVMLELQQRAMAQEQITAVGGIVPFCLLEPYALVGLNLWTWYGVPSVQTTSYPFEIQSCEVSLKTFEMTMTLARAVPV